MADYYGVPHSYVLAHHGIKGQRWGVRRFQYENGVLTPAGRERYGRDLSSFSNADLRSRVKRKQLENDLSRLERKRSGKGKVLRDVGNIIGDASGIVGNVANIAGKGKGRVAKVSSGTSEVAKSGTKLFDYLDKKMEKNSKNDYEPLTDDELRAKIERLRLETDYEKLIKDTSTVGKGLEITKEVLGVVGPVVAVVGGVITIKNAFGHSDFYLSHDDELYHYGIIGMKWGVRRFQNYDGSLTQRGLNRYKKSEDEYKTTMRNVKNGIGSASDVHRAKANLDKSYNQLKKANRLDRGYKLEKKGRKISQKAKEEREERYQDRKNRALRTIGTGASELLLSMYLGKDNPFGEQMAHMSYASLFGGAASYAINQGRRMSDLHKDALQSEWLDHKSR